MVFLMGLRVSGFLYECPKTICGPGSVDGAEVKNESQPLQRGMGAVRGVAYTIFPPRLPHSASVLSPYRLLGLEQRNSRR